MSCSKQWTYLDTCCILCICVSTIASKSSPLRWVAGVQLFSAWAIRPIDSEHLVQPVPAQHEVVGEIPAALFQLIEVTNGLSLAPCAQRVGADAQQIGFGKAGETKCPTS